MKAYEESKEKLDRLLRDGTDNTCLGEILALMHSYRGGGARSERGAQIRADVSDLCKEIFRGASGRSEEIYSENLFATACVSLRRLQQTDNGAKAEEVQSFR